MIFSVIPFSHSLGTEGLLYFAGSIDPKDITVGSIVEIPYGNHEEYGLIGQIHTTLPENISEEQYNRIRSCKRLITNKSIIANYQIEMIEAIAKKYMIPIHRVLSIFLTKPILNRLEKKNYETVFLNNHREIISNSKLLYILQNGIITPVFLKDYIQESTVIIVPDDFSIIPYEKYFSERKNIFFLKNEMTDIKKAQAWIDIYNNKYSIIYGTRKILYYNLSAYKNIIYIEDSLGNNYWHYPIKMRYIDILRIFAKSNPSTNITLLTSVPTLTTLQLFRDFTIKNLSQE